VGTSAGDAAFILRSATDRRHLRAAGCDAVDVRADHLFLTALLISRSCCSTKQPAHKHMNTEHIATACRGKTKRPAYFCEYEPPWIKDRLSFRIRLTAQPSGLDQPAWTQSGARNAVSASSLTTTEPCRSRERSGFIGFTELAPTGLCAYVLCARVAQPCPQPRTLPAAASVLTSRLLASANSSPNRKAGSCCRSRRRRRKW